VQTKIKNLVVYRIKVIMYWATVNFQVIGHVVANLTIVNHVQLASTISFRWIPLKHRTSSTLRFGL